MKSYLPKGFSFIPIIVAVLVITLAGLVGYIYRDNLKGYFGNSTTSSQSTQAETGGGTGEVQPDSPDFEGITPIGTDAPKLVSKLSEKEALKSEKEASNPDDLSKPFNILILGIDRRHGDQTNWRTDVIQLLTLSADRKKSVVTHIPRDVWAGTYKINGVYNLQGPDAMKDIVQEITGQRPDRVIRVDFDAFVWAIDMVGGVTVNVPTSFTDSGYPNDRKGINEPITVSFDAGEQVMDGETALIYARSRKGTNGEGSDYARGRRQQLVMKSAVGDLFKPDNLFNPKNAQTLYDIATQKIYTDISLADTEILYTLLVKYKDIQVTGISLDTTNYLEVPADKTPYGGAWVLIAKNGDYKPIHEAITNSLH